jgi:uncharacterized phage protein gp47/JayE
MIGSPSDPLVVTSKQINLSVIALGGPGVLGRKIYRNDSGAGFKLLVLIPDNSTTIYTDNTLTSGLTASPPTESTAERVTLGAESIDVGRRFNVAPQTITNVSNAPGGIVGVTNISAFTGGTEGQDFEDYRQGLMEFIGNPQSGSPGDLKSWAEGVDGVEEASVFVNDNLGTPMNGHNTIRITGTGGVIPSAEVVAATQLALDTEDLANITNHVTTFTPNTINTTVNATPHPDYSLAEITPQIQEAVANYINFIGVGQTVYRAGLVDAVFGLPGVVNVTVTTPASDVTSTAVQKPVSNVVTVNAL